MSDTHGNRKAMHAAAEAMAGAGAALIYHLGDDYEDAEELAMAGHTVRMVPGLWCDAYRGRGVPRTRVDEVGWLTVSCAHSPDDLGGKERRATLVMHGHTHCAMLEARGGAVWLNPGHLKRPLDRGAAASFAMVQVLDDMLRCAIHETDGTVRETQSFARASLAEQGA